MKQTSYDQAVRDGWLAKWNEYWADPDRFETILDSRDEQCGAPQKGVTPPPFDTGIFEEFEKHILQHDVDKQLQPMDHIAFTTWRIRDRRRT